MVAPAATKQTLALHGRHCVSNLRHRHYHSHLLAGRGKLVKTDTSVHSGSPFIDSVKNEEMATNLICDFETQFQYICH